MHQQKFQLNNQRTPTKNSNFSFCQTQNQNLQPNISLTNEYLGNQQEVQFSENMQKNSHSAFCNQAQVQARKQKYNLAFDMCLKAIQYPSECKKCISLLFQLYDVLLPRRLPFLDLLFKRCQNREIQDLQIYMNLKKIKENEKSSQVYQDLLRDLQQNGAEFSKISINSQNIDNRTIVARTEIEKDQTILFVPKKKLILLQNARESQIVKNIRRQRLYLKSPKHCQLTIFLLEEVEKGEKSAFWFYIKHLPQSFDNFPINYKPNELSYLKGSPFLQQVEQKIDDIRSDYNAICSICPQFQRFSLEDFKRFRLIVSSRLFGINIGKFRTDALVPLADMLNHNMPKQTSWYYSDQHEGFVIKSTTKIEKGQQIYDSYGPKCNSRFLLNYGFTMPHNDLNQVTIKVPFEYQEEDRKQIYRQVTLKVTTDIQSKEFQELIAILRHSIIQQYDQHREDVSIQKIKSTPFVNLDIEAQIWQKLQKIVETQLNAFPTTLKEDRKLLLAQDLSINQFNCLILRKGQKQILHFYLNMARRMIKYFRGSMGKKAAQQVQQYQSYLKKLIFS